MANKRKPLRKGQAHVEYLALKAVIEELAKAGHNLKSIYDKLREEGRISMSYQALHENMTRADRKSRQGQKAGGAGVHIQPPSAQVSKWRESIAPSVPSLGREVPPPAPEIQLKDLDAALEQAAALREKAPQKSGKEGHDYSRKKVIG